MQQQPCTDPLSGQNTQQQMSQQMVLCPVRLVYETQIFVQPGDQIQPNQTIFVNQNIPPWVQNSPIQNQMVYVQQYPSGNIVPTIQPQIDQNQMYIQHNMANFQQVYAQNLQEQQLRPPMQLTNIIPSSMGMVPNLQTSLSPNVQTVSNQRIIQTLPNMRPPVPNMMQNMDNIRNIVPNNPQIVPNMQVTMPQQFQQVVINSPKQMQPQNSQATYRNAGPQTVQQQNSIARPHISINQIQNQTNINNLQQFVTNVDPKFGHNMEQRNPAMQQSLGNQTIPPTSTNITPSMSTGTIIRKLAPPTNLTKVNNNPMNTPQSNLGVRNYSPYMYRAIQPRPQYRNTLSVSPVTVKTVPNQPLIQTPNILPNVPNIDQNTIRPLNQNPNLINPNIFSTPNNAMICDNNTPVSKKRKSESPDVFRKKIFIASPQNNNSSMLTIQENKSINNMNNPNSNNIDDTSINTVNLPKIEDKPKAITTSLPQIIPHNIQLTKVNNEQSVNVKLTTSNQSTPADVEKLNVRDTMQQTDKDKLVRNTVFPQARGRLLNDKQNIPVTVVKHQKDITNKEEVVLSAPKTVSTSTTTEDIREKTEFIETNGKNYRKLDQETNIDNNRADNNTIDNNKAYNDKNDNHKAENNKVVANNKADNNRADNEKSDNNIADNNKVVNNKTDNNKVVNNSTDRDNIADNNSADNEKPDNNIADNNKVVNNKTDNNTGDNNSADKDKADNNRAVNNKNVNNRAQNSNVDDNKADSNRVDNNKVVPNKRNDVVVSINDMRGKEIHFTDGNIKKQDRIEDDFVLTHVLDGYVIQESNIAFPIRKPLIERTIYANTKTDREKQRRDHKRDTKDINIKDNSKIVNISHLHLLEEKPELTDVKNEECKEETENMDNPFASLRPSTVKTWTMDQLETHLSKYDWRETIALFREHEIDGESLFLVSKPQLVTIGVDEKHADIICEFVKS